MAGEREAGSDPGPADDDDDVAMPVPLHRLVRSWTWARWLPLALVVVRVLAVVGLHPYLYVDSAEYEVLDLSGRSRRPWATPLLYQLVPGDHRWEIVGQAVVGGIAWGVLALAVAAWFREPRVRLVAVALVVALGLTTSVTNWDTAILSESLALSLTAVLVAAWLDLVRRPTWIAAALVVAVTVPWLFVRQSLLPSAVLMAGTALVAALSTWRRGGAWRQLAAVAAALTVLCAVASASYSRNQEVVHTNLTVIVANRVAPDPDRLAWFGDHGMPVPPAGSLDVGALNQDQDFGRWVRREGRGTYARYLLTHPWYAVTEPLPDLVGVRIAYGDESEPQATMLAPADAYGSARPVIPELVERAVFEPGGTGAVLAGVAAVVGLSLLRRRHRDRRWALPLTLVAISLVSMVVGWHGATPELGRLAIVAAVVLRLGLILQLGLLAEGELARRKDGRRVGLAAYPRPG